MEIIKFTLEKTSIKYEKENNLKIRFSNHYNL